MHKIRLWGEFHLTEDQIQDVSVVHSKAFSESDSQKINGKYLPAIYIGLGTALFVGAVVFLFFGLLGNAFFAAFISAQIGFASSLKYLEKKEKKLGHYVYRVRVKAVVAGSVEFYVSEEEWLVEEDAELAARGILEQMQSDALRKNSHLF